jgi:hypothetical protein
MAALNFEHRRGCSSPRFTLVTIQRESHVVRAVEDGVIYAEAAGEFGDIVGGDLTCECGAQETYNEDAMPDFEYEN